MVKIIYAFLVEFILGFMKIDFIILVVFGNERFLVEDIRGFLGYIFIVDGNLNFDIKWVMFIFWNFVKFFV